MTLILARAGGRFLTHLPFGPRLPLLTLPPLEGRGFLLQWGDLFNQAGARENRGRLSTSVFGL
ncbi:MAG: hypothetical protein F6K55_24340 [Moorea sp. SIO4A3]|nr:hypothetical protein [Moorena sp. SIO4A3]